MHVPYNLDRDAFDLLVQRILIGKNKCVTHVTRNDAYTEFSDGASKIYRAYMLFTFDDFQEVAEKTSPIGECRIYAQEGYAPSVRELRDLGKSGIDIAYANPQHMALDALNYDLISWVANAGHENRKAMLSVSTGLHGAPTQPSLHEAITF